MAPRNHLIIAGAQRSGTTLVYHLLDKHPNILMARPVKPEPKFFLKEEEYLLGYEHYLKYYFGGKSKFTWYGEKTTSYMEFKEVPSKIRSIIPNASVIFILRNPVYRAISNYYFSLKNNLESRSIEEVFLKQTPAPKIDTNISAPPFNYIERGVYLPYLKNYYKHFPADQIKILILERLLSVSSEEFSSLFDHLKLNPPEASQEILNKKINSNIMDYDSLRIGSIINKLNDIYKKSIEELEQYTNIDLSIWKISS